MTIAKVLLVLMLFIIIFILFRGLYFMVKHKGDPKKTVNALSWRIGLSVLLIILLIIAVATGVIEPHGVQP